MLRLERANYFEPGFREDNVTDTIIGDSRHACVSRSIPRSMSFQFKDKESCTEKKIDRRGDANVFPSLSLLLHGAKNRGATRTQKLVTERLDERN